MAITGGFGSTMDLERGTSRQWVMGRDGVKRWADSGEPVDACGCREGECESKTGKRCRMADEVKRGGVQ
jgi:hypothetical protein